MQYLKWITHKVLLYSTRNSTQCYVAAWMGETFPFSRGSSQPRDQTQVSLIAGGFFTNWATGEAQEYWGGWPILSPADLPDPGIELGSPALQVDFLPTVLSGKPYMQSISCKMLGWMKHKLESRSLEEISITTNMYHPYGRKWRGAEDLPDESERGEWKC